MALQTRKNVQKEKEALKSHKIHIAFQEVNSTW